VSDQRRFTWINRGWSPISSIWQADGLNRSVRDPQIPTLPLEDPAPSSAMPFFTALICAVTAVPVLALGSVFVPPNLVIQSAAPPADTTVLRAPTYQQAKTPPAVTAVQPPNLLTSTLAVTVTPAPFVPLQQASLPRTLPAYANTSQSSALSLVAVVSPPVVVPIQLGPQAKPYQPANTSLGTAKTLTQDAQLPFQVLAQTAPDRLRPVTDTSQKQPITLQVIVPPAPFVPAQWPGVQRYPSLPADTSHGQINPDAQAPVGGSAAWAPIALVRNVVDTTQKQPITLQVIVPPPPIVNLPNYGPVRFFWQPEDTSAGVAKVLIADAQLPFRTQFLQPQSQHRIWAVFNTSQSTPVELFPAVVPPTSTEYAYTFIGV
jgi:hypothetical protein